MHTHCTATQLEFQGLGTRRVVADFDGGHVSSNGGVVLLRELDARMGFTRRFAGCFADHRDRDRIEHTVEELVAQRAHGLALGYEDLLDHDALSSDPLMAMAAGKADLEGRARKRTRDCGKALASKSTLNRLELTPGDAGTDSRYKKIVYDAGAVEDLFVDWFLEAHEAAPAEVILDFDATDDPVHGEQEGRFFHGYYGHYCYLPLYVFCGDHLLFARLRTADRDAADGSLEALVWLVGRIRARWPGVRILVRGDSGFARDGLMDWCEDNGVHYLFGLARNKRLQQRIAPAMADAHARHLLTGRAARVFEEFTWRTMTGWSRARRVIAKAEYLAQGPNPRLIVTNLPAHYATPKDLYERVYCARGDMENRIKEQQLDLFADRTSTHTMRANQLRLWLSSLAYVMMSALRRTALAPTRLARATCQTIRLKLLKLGARVCVSVRRVRLYLTSACPDEDVFRQAHQAIRALPMRC